MLQMKRIRSFLFVPGSRPTWIKKALSSNADALILDLEDSVPPSEKDQARITVSNAISELAGSDKRIFVRVNVDAMGTLPKDIKAITRKGLEGIVLPKVRGPEDIEAADKLIFNGETEIGLAPKTVSVVATLEHARGIELAYQCALQERVTALIGATAKNADVARSVGFQWTAAGLETLFLRSRVVVAARAAGKLPIGGLWQQVHDLEGLRVSASFNRTLGMTGEISIHPSNVPVLNEIYSPTPDEVAYFEGMLAAYDHSIANGQSAFIYEGEHVDVAHITTARELISLAREYTK
jgi:citrate lyase subunit beta / citryl-CoA lyase